MLFNSFEFIFVFLPVVLAGWFALGRYGDRRLAVAWLVLASLFFYGWWNPAYLPLLIGSMIFNYGCGRWLMRRPDKNVLIVGVVANLALLAHFKYAGFLLENAAHLTGADLLIPQIVLPIGISFYTFLQIAWLVDVWRGKGRERDVWSYMLFVTYFPHLIAGPIVHHSELMPQFRRAEALRPDGRAFAFGFAIFAIGLFKKVVIADSLARGLVDPVFFTAANGKEVLFGAAWQAALAYTFQIYFDFSGYSDMAIGLSWLFGVRLPENFDSPYKATNIADFWRRWHMTLSRFLREYLYIPLGGNRCGKIRHGLNVMIVMLLGGLWHGAAWSFVIWGGLHGVFLLIHRAWRWELPAAAGRALTFLAVVFAWVVFRAQNEQAIKGMFSAMATPGGGFTLGAAGVLAGLLVFIFRAPNTRELMERWQPRALWAWTSLTLFAVSVLLLHQEKTFIYFQF